VIEHATGQRLVRMELKYCESCGGLLLRRSGEQIVYCGACQARLAELPQTDADQPKATHPRVGRCEKAAAKPTVDKQARGSDGPSVPRVPPASAVTCTTADDERRFA
jgi:uncharacterized Zn finger protein (UPF0148 family)